jgi:hypothetical protein
MRNLQEANKIYTQRYREKQREKLGNEEYKKVKSDYMKLYRENRMKKEGYVKPERVQEVPIERPPEPTKRIILKPVNTIKKTTVKGKKQIATVELQQSKLKLKPLSETSIKNYLQNITVLHHDLMKKPLGTFKQEIIKALKGQNFDANGLKNELSYFKKDKVPDTIQHLREKYSNENTFKTKINSITSLLGRLQGFNDEYSYFSNLNIELQKEYTKNRDLNEITADEMATLKLIDFNTEKINKNLQKLDKIQDKALYIIYMFIPRRLEIRDVKIKKNITDKDTGNYVKLDRYNVPNEFIFNSYKTDKTYGRQIIDVPDAVKEILYEYIDEYALTTNDYLFPLQRSNKEPIEQSAFSKYFSNVFKKVYGKPVTNQMLRIAYATYWTTRAKNLAEKKKISFTQLSHDLVTNEQYVKLYISSQ